MKTSPLYKEVKKLLREYKTQDPKNAKIIKKLLRIMNNKVKAERRIHESILVERYALDYYFLEPQLNHFAESFLGAVKFVISNSLQREELRSDVYDVEIIESDQAVTFRVKDSMGFCYMQNTFGCERM